MGVLDVLRNWLQAEFTRYNYITKNPTEFDLETSDSTKYDLDLLEVRIKEREGDVSFYKRILRYKKDRNRYQMTIENIEKDKPEMLDYYVDIHRGSYYYRSSWINGINDNFHDGNGFTLRDALLFYTGEESPEIVEFTYDQLIEMKEKIKKNIHDKKYVNLYCFRKKKSDGLNSNAEAQLVYREIHEIPGTYEVEEKIYDFNTGNQIGETLKRKSAADDYFLESARKNYDVEEICPSERTKGYYIKPFYTKLALEQFAKRYEREHPEIVLSEILQTDLKELSFCPRVNTPIAPKNFLPQNKCGILKQETEPVLPGEE